MSNPLSCTYIYQTATNQNSAGTLHTPAQRPERGSTASFRKGQITRYLFSITPKDTLEILQASLTSMPPHTARKRLFLDPPKHDNFCVQIDKQNTKSNSKRVNQYNWERKNDQALILSQTIPCRFTRNPRALFETQSYFRAYSHHNLLSPSETEFLSRWR